MKHFIRFFGSALIASIIVVFGAGIIIHYFEKPQEDKSGPVAISGVQEFRLADRPDIQRLLAEQHQRAMRRPPEKPKPPPPPQREVSGFVQLSFTVKANGSVSDVHVIGAAPKGYYEQQAKQIIKSRSYAPAKDSGRPLARQASDIVHFTVPEKQSKTSATPAAGST